MGEQRLISAVGIFCILGSGWIKIGMEGILFFLSDGSVGQAAELRCGPGRTYSSIQSAIEAADNYDTIIVDPCIYYENIDFSGKAITLTSTDPCDPCIVAATIIDGSFPSDPNNASVVTFGSGEGHDSILRGFTIRGGTGSWILADIFSSVEQIFYPIWNRCGGGVICYNFSEPTITRNVIRDNLAGQGGGFYVYGDPCHTGDPCDSSVRVAPLIIKNVFKNNQALKEHGFDPPNTDYPNNDHGDGGAIVGFQACDVVIVGNEIIDNQGEWYGGGIHLRQWVHGQITDNHIIDNGATFGAGIHLTYRSSPTIKYNLIEENRGGGIFVYGSSDPLISHNIVRNNLYGAGAGIEVNYGSTPIIIHNLIIGNQASTYGGGIKCSASNPTIKFNTLYGNSAPFLGAGISCQYSSSPLIEHNQVINNTNDSGIYVMDTLAYPANPIIRYNNVYRNEDDNYSGDISDQTGMNGNISEFPGFIDSAGGDYHLYYTSSCIDAGDPCFEGQGMEDFEGNPRKMGKSVDIGAYETWPVWNITSDDKYLVIQQAIDDACDGERLVVLPGRYIENLNFNGKNVIVESIDPNDWDIVEQTIIDGNDVDTVATFINEEDANCVLAGFTITGGLASSDNGGGIRIYNAGVTIRNNLITGNSANKGSGINMYYSHSQILNNRIINNIGPAISQGGGMMIINCNPVMHVLPAPPVIANNIIVGNRALYGGGIRIQNSAGAHINNNVVAYNRAKWEGIGIYAELGTTIENCIIWGNENVGIFGNGSSVYQYSSVTYSCIDEVIAGAGNIFEDPCFTDPGYWDDVGTPADLDDDVFVFGNYHLPPGSPCIDMGDNGSVPTSLTTDFDGEPRAANEQVDIGADELYYPPYDLNQDGIVDVIDLSLLTWNWLAEGPELVGDFFPDEIVNLKDFAILARWWLWQGPWNSL